MKILLIILAIIYFLSPYDIMPDFLVGWGWLDDGAVLYMLWRYVVAPMIQRKQAERLYQQHWHYSQGSQRPGGNRGQDFQSDSAAGEDGFYRDPYQVLGIERNASQEEIKAAFKQLAMKYHPDKVQHLGEEFQVLAENRFKEIQEAYQALKASR